MSLYQLACHTTNRPGDIVLLAGPYHSAGVIIKVLKPDFKIPNGAKVTGRIGYHGQAVHLCLIRGLSDRPNATQGYAWGWECQA